jgi:hypothetical protein
LSLTLIGGKTGAEVEGHDWEFILTQLGITHLDHAIGTVTHAIGIITMVAALVYAGTTIVRGPAPSE